MKPKKSFTNSKLWREIPLYIMIIPAFVLVLIYSYGAMLGIGTAFQNYKPSNGAFFGSPWVGMKNFQTLFSMPNIWPIIRNTVVISLFKMAGGIIVPVTFALLLNEVKNNFLKRSFQTFVYLPNFLSWVVLAGIFLDMFAKEGIINSLLSNFGVTPIIFFGDKTWFPVLMVITEIWKGFGFGSVIYLSGLTGIDPSLYEAAEIDGADRWKQTLHVTLPSIMGLIVLMTVLSMGNVLNGGFDQIYNMYNTSVYETGDILDTFVYRLGIESAQYALATAAGLFKSIISFIFVVVSYQLADKIAGYRIY